MQKTADEMRIRCWGSDVCSSDLIPKADRDALLREEAEHAAEEAALRAESDDDADVLDADEDMLDRFDDDAAEIDDSEAGDDGDEIGRASGRGRVGQHVLITVVAESVKKNNIYITIRDVRLINTPKYTRDVLQD